MRERIRQNWETTQSAVRSATLEANRPVDSVRIVGVSKYVDAETTEMLVAAGCDQLGENRPQALWQKAEYFGENAKVNWHMIGHVQTNKLRRMMRHRPLIHSVDSERLLAAIDAEAAHQNFVCDVLLEVNISGDQSKTGLSPESLRGILTTSMPPHVKVLGLMAMAGWGTAREEAAAQFEKVAHLRDELQETASLPLPELSMGMSGDYREAIAAGATLVRIGSALFEGVLLP